MHGFSIVRWIDIECREWILTDRSNNIMTADGGRGRGLGYDILYARGYESSEFYSSNRGSIGVLLGDQVICVDRWLIR